MIETSETTAKLDSALAKAQGEFAAAMRDSNNPHFKSKYADLTAIMEAIRPTLTKHGISVTQWPLHSEDNRVHMITRIAHDGEWMRGHFSMPVAKQDAHGYGSIVTYLRRYCVSACLGVITDLEQDDDGNAASGKPTAAPTAAKSPPTYDRNPIVKDAFTELQNGIRQCANVGTMDDLKMFWTANAKKIAAMPADWKTELEDMKEEAKVTLEQRAA